MAAFATFAAAEARAEAKVKDGTWINAYASRSLTGAGYAVEVQRFMSATHPDYGAWVEITDDATT